MKEILEYNLILGSFSINLLQVTAALLVIVVARIMLWILLRVLQRYFQRKEIDKGRQYAVAQFVKYIVYVLALLAAFEAVGISLSVLWGGAAALMVGIGLGLQGTFHNLISGIILLIEGSIQVGDVMDVNGIVGTVTDIGIRTCKLETRDQISILIPNSKMVGDNAINWSLSQEPTRFQIKVGVAYASDIKKVTQILLTAASQNSSVLKTPIPKVQFTDFGNSSLDFLLHFHCIEYMRIEMVKSEIRYEITRLFRENKVEIPFPQQDLWLRNAVNLNQPDA